MKLDMRVEVPERLKKYLNNPTPFIKAARKDADKVALFFLRDEISSAAPRDSGDLAGSIEVNLAKRNVFSKLVYSRAVELGHFAEAEPGKHLRFPGASQGGTYVFPTKRRADGTLGSFIRTKAQPFFFNTLSKNQLNVINIYERAFAKMLKRI